MIRFKSTTNSQRFRPLAVSVQALDAMAATDGFPFHIGSEGKTDERLPWQVQAFHRFRYCEEFSEITVDKIAARPVVRLSMSDEISNGHSAIIMESGLETLAAFKDIGIEQIEVEVLWREASEIEARLSA